MAATERTFRCLPEQLFAVLTEPKTYPGWLIGAKRIRSVSPAWPEVDSYFEHEAHRTVISQRALQVHTDPLLGYTTLDGVGYVVSEVSPYEVDLDWSGLSEPRDIASVVDLLGRATAKVHCSSDEDSDQELVHFQVEHAIEAALKGRRRQFTQDLVDFGIGYAETVREDHRLFVDAFRESRVGVSST